MSGKRRDLPRFSWQNGGTSVQLKFEPHGSMFVVFRRAVSSASAEAMENFSTFSDVVELKGPWEVSFDPTWFYRLMGSVAMLLKAVPWRR